MLILILYINFKGIIPIENMDYVFLTENFKIQIGFSANKLVKQSFWYKRANKS